MFSATESKQRQTAGAARVLGVAGRLGDGAGLAAAQKTVIWLGDGIEIIPMVEGNGPANFSDLFLGQVFRRIVREESLHKLFYDGSVRDTRDFRKFIHNPENEIFFVRSHDKEVGFFWLNHFRQKAFFINYCFYREYWGEAALKIGNTCIEHLFTGKDPDGDFLVDVLLGLTPANNKLAVSFLLKSGMTILGKIPDFLYDAAREEYVAGVFSYRQRCKKTGFRMPSLFFG